MNLSCSIAHPVFFILTWHDGIIVNVVWAHWKGSMGLMVFDSRSLFSYYQVWHLIGMAQLVRMKF